MIKGIKISTKITLVIFILSLTALTAISFFTYDYVTKINHEKSQSLLQATADNRLQYLNTYFDKAERGIRLLQYFINNNSILSANNSSKVTGNLRKGKQDNSEKEDSTFISYLRFQQEIFEFEHILITSSNGAISASTQGKIGNFLDPDGLTFQQSQKGIYFSMIRSDSLGYHGYAAAPVKTAAGNRLLVVKLNLRDAFKIFLDAEISGTTGEIFLVQHNPFLNKIYPLTSLRNNSIMKALREDDPMVANILKTFHGTATGNPTGNDTANSVFEEQRKINHANLVLVARMDIADAKGENKHFVKIFLYSALCVITFATLLSMVFSRSLTMPLYTMRNKLNLVAQGILPENTENYNGDEFGQMAQKVDELVRNLKRSALLAQNIGEGKYDTEFKPVSDEDSLGISLINMRNSLIKNDRRDSERNWIFRGMAEASEILRRHNSIDDLGEDVIRFILEKIGAIQGAFYVVQEDASGQKNIEMHASYAYNRKKYLKARFKFSEGLVGQAASERDIILRTEIPEDYVSITSGILGDQRPKCLLIVPLINNEEVYGVLEFAGFRKFVPSQVQFVQELSIILARTIFNIKVNQRTRVLLAESQGMSNELKEKQEVLRQNAEEMQATQEELKRSNHMLETQVEEVNRTQKRMQLLLENASEVITIYEEDETIRYISPSVVPILGYGPKELIGKSDIEKIHPDHKETYRDFFVRMNEKPGGKITVQYAFQTKDGNYKWIESTGSNCMSNPAIHGYILNSRDITERRSAEEEQRMRSKMQALSENSPDLITRLEENIISYINPVIEFYTGKTPLAFMNKEARETELDKDVLESWLKIVEQVIQTKGKIATEMEFPSSIGMRVMQVNAIPEYDGNEKLESVLVVSHDITDRKIIEHEIQNKNKKITESINYAKRIQSAILPNTKLINRALPDSFILYKPRDVVSGDFPWFAQVKNEIFIAAVDCTGHGVPGALLSLIGYFLLNDIVRSRKITDPGKILDLLDEGVTTTLRQDEDASTRDGMDISLCKINLAERVVEYAGAHRPLYIMKGGVMEEVKGNKFPIGGGIFKNQTNFTNTKIKLGKGDSIYYCSDGFPDQFGGPDGRKLGPKKMREIIENIHTMPMKEAMLIFEEQWETWKGNLKQTDDVLLMGIKF